MKITNAPRLALHDLETKKASAAELKVRTTLRAGALPPHTSCCGQCCPDDSI